MKTLIATLLLGFCSVSSATIFGPGLTIVLLLLFTTLELWDKLRGEEELKSHAKAA
jgi:hypothetical protein